MLDLLAEFANAGIVNYERDKTFFYPTRLGTTLNTGGLNSLQEQDRDGFIIVETNYRLYAYTSRHVFLNLSLYIPKDGFAGFDNYWREETQALDERPSET